MVRVDIIVEGEAVDAIYSIKKLIFGSEQTNTINTVPENQQSKQLLETNQKPKPQQNINSCVSTVWNRNLVRDIINSNSDDNISIYNEINSNISNGINIDELSKNLKLSQQRIYTFIGNQTRIINTINKNHRINLSNPITYDKKRKTFYIDTLFSDLYTSITEENDQNSATQSINEPTYAPWTTQLINQLISSLNINNQTILHELKSQKNYTMSVDELCDSLSISAKNVRACHVSIITVTKRLNRENNIALMPAVDYDRKGKILTMRKDFAVKFR